MKKFCLLFFVAVISVFIAAFSCACAGAQNNDEEKAKSRWDDGVVFSDSEIYVPENSRIGFYYIEPDGRTYTKANYGKNLRDELFDPTKPTLIFIHGMQVNTGYKGDEGMGTSYPADEGMEDDTVFEYTLWKEAGYNTLAFNYSAYADDGLVEIISKVWGVNSKNSVNMRWAYPDENGAKVYETVDIPNACIAEIFAHEYAALFKNYTGREVRLSCHSMGGQVLTAAAEILNDLDDRGEIPHSAMPARITYLDPYIEDFFKEDEEVTYYNGKPYIGAYQKLLEIAPKLYEKGTCIEYFDGEIGFRWNEATAMDEAHFTALQKECAYIDFLIAPDGLVQNFAIDFLGQYHNIVKHVYIYSLILDLIPDSTVEGSGNYSLSAALPTEIVDSYKGNTYDMIPTYTFDPSDDVITMRNERTGATVFGYAFLDKNQNGLRDEDYTNRLSGVTVTLFDEADNLVASTTTDKAGRYRFDELEKGNYYVTFNAGENYAATQKDAQDNGEMLNSNVSQNFKSDAVTLVTNVSYAYVNAGFIESGSNNEN